MAFGVAFLWAFAHVYAHARVIDHTRVFLINLNIISMRRNGERGKGERGGCRWLLAFCQGFFDAIFASPPQFLRLVLAAA